MRKAVWGAALLGVSALTYGSPVRDIRLLHSLLSLTGLAGYIVLSLDPPVRSVEQRNLLLAGVVASAAAFILVVTGAPFPLNIVARVLAIATIALPLWLVAGPVRYGFVAAAAIAAFTAIPAIDGAGPYATSVHAYVAAACAFLVAAKLNDPNLFTPGERKPPRVVVASNIVTLTPEQKAKALARLEKQYTAGEMPEHVYLDKRQELESR